VVDGRAGASEQPVTAYRRAILRAGAACGIAGAVLLVVANVAHPRPPTSDVGDDEEYLRLAAESSGWLAVHLLILLGLVLVLGGLLALAYSLFEAKPALLARAALAGALVGSAVNLVRGSLDAAFGEVADDWAAASGDERETLLQVGTVLGDVEFTLFSVNIVFFYGLTFVLYGLAVAVSDTYAQPLGWVAVAAGAGAAGVGVSQLFTGPSVATLFVFPAFAAVLSGWVVAMGVLVWRRAAVAA
jgi:hypothetical protein